MTRAEAEGDRASKDAYRDSILEELRALREMVSELVAWSSTYLDKQTGMGSGLNVEKWPSLTPSAAKHMREMVRHTRRNIPTKEGGAQ